VAHSSSNIDLDGFLRDFFEVRPATDRQAEPAKPKVTVEELVRRGTSIVRVGEKTYRIRVSEVELTK